MSFPGCEDYEESPVAELPLAEQIAYWQERALVAEELAQKYRELFKVEAELNEPDPSDWWKEDGGAL